MSELTLTIMRLGLLVLLWIFVFSVVGVLRGDLYGTRVVSRSAHRGKRAFTPRRGQVPAAPTGQSGAETGSGRGPRPPSRLTVTAGPLTGTTLPLKSSGTLVGRNPEAALVLDDDFASGRHARIFQQGRDWFVEDLGSTNGTFLDNAKLTSPAPVGAGSVLRIGKTVIELRK